MPDFFGRDVHMRPCGRQKKVTGEEKRRGHLIFNLGGERIGWRERRGERRRENAFVAAA